MKDSKEKFIIELASSSDDNIRIKHKDDYVMGYISGNNLVLEESNKLINKGDLKFRLFVIGYFLIFYFLGKALYPSLLSLFMSFSSNIMATFYILSLYVALLITLLFVFFIRFFVTESFKKNHSVEHMMVDFINKNERLPKNLEEVKAMPHRSIYCGTTSSIVGLITMAVLYFILLIIFSVIKAIIATKVDVSQIFEAIGIVAIFALMLVIMTVIEKRDVEKRPFMKQSRKLSIALQRWTTSPDYTDENLVMVYFIAEYWGELFNQSILKDANTEYWNKLANSFGWNIVKE